MYTLLGTRMESTTTSLYKYRICNTAGFIVNTTIADSYSLTQSGIFCCFFCASFAVARIKFEDELWLDDTGYALPDDQVFFYKAFLRGLRVVYAGPIRYRHLDAGAGRGKKAYNCFPSGRNFLIFWHRFLYVRKDSIAKKIWSFLCFGYRVLAHCCYYAMTCIRIGSFEPLRTYVGGCCAGLRFLKSERYKTLEKI